MRRILVIDDNPGTRFLIKEALEPEGYEVHEAADGNEAMTLCRNGQFDLVISDIMMPNTNGISVIEKLRREAPDTRIIAMTSGQADEQKDFLIMAKILGAKRALRKPLDLGVLIDTVRQVSESQRARG